MDIDFTPDPALFPFQSRFFASSAGRVHYIDEGDGPAVLFLHGNPTWSFLYRGIVSDLRDAFRCVAVDYPGFGLSDRPAGYGYTPAEHARIVGELVDHLALDDFVVMGQDWGGPIGGSVAADRHERVRGLVLGNTWLWPLRAASAKIFSRVMSSPPLQWAILKRNFFVERVIPAVTATRLPDEVMDHYRKVQPSPEARVGVAQFPRQILAATPFLEQLWPQVKEELASKPLLLVWGMKDRAIPPKPGMPKLLRTFADATVVELPEAKHFIQEDAPREIAGAIRSRFG